MAEDTDVKLTNEKPCCAKMKERCSKLKEKRSMLLRALQSFEPRIDALQNEKLNAIKAYEAERARAELVKEEKEKESAVRADLEKEILELKSAMASLQQNKGTEKSDGDCDVTQLRTCVSELEGENHRLKKLLEKQKHRADMEKKRFEAEKKEAENAYKVEKEAKLNESAARAGLEDEIVNLKSEIASLKQNQATENSDDDCKVILLQTNVSELEGEIDRLKVLLDEEKQRADLEKKKIEAEKKEAEDTCKVEKEAKLNESAARAGLEDEVLNLKSLIASLNESTGTLHRDEGEVVLLQSRVSEGEAEISRLKELLASEREMVDLEKKRDEAEKKNAEEACKIEVEARVKESSLRASLEGEVVLLQSRVSGGEAEIGGLKELLAREREMVDLEKKKAEAEKKNAEEARKIEEEERVKGSSLRASLENEISDLKSELALLQAEKASKSQDESGEIVLLQTRVSEVETESIHLKELLDQERKRADSEKKKAKAEKKKTKAEKEKAVARNLEYEANLKHSAGLENEISKLKLELASLQEKMEARGQDEVNETLLLQSRISKGDAEIQRLNMLLNKERNRVDSEKKKASEAWQIVNSEKNKAAEEKRLGDIQRHYAEEYRLSLEASKAELNELKAKLVVERSRIEELHRKLEAEKQTTTREKIRADLERAKAEEQMKCVEDEKKKLMNERNRSDHLCQKLEEARQVVEAKEKEKQEIISARKMKETLPMTSDASRNADGNLTFLEKQLKLEKMHAKHAKRAAKIEKVRNNLLEQELYRLKQDFFHFGHRLNVLDGSFSNGGEGIDALAKINNSSKVQRSGGNERLSGKEPFSLYGKGENELVKARYTSMDWFDRFRSNVEQHSAPLSDGSGSSTKPSSGTTSALESLGGSVRDKLQNYAIYSNSTSFSDRPSLGSQENNIFSVQRPDSLRENLEQGPVVPRLSTESSRHNINGNWEVAERSLKVPHHRDLENPSVSLKKHDGIIVVGRDPASKRKRLFDEVEPIECLCTVPRNSHTQTEENPTAVNDTLIPESNVLIATSSQMIGELDASGDGRCPNAILLDDLHARDCSSSKKRKVSLIQNQNLQTDSEDVNKLTDNLENVITKDVEVLNQASHANFIETDQSRGDEAVDIGELNQEAELSPENLPCDYFSKLLEYDDPEKDERFRMAMEMPLSPTLPEIEMRNMEAFPLDANHLEFKSSGTGATHPPQVSKSSTEMGFTEQISGNEVMGVPSTNSGREKDTNIFKCFVAFPNTKDKRRISRMISAYEICISTCSILSQNVWMVEKILVALVEEDLLPEEKACVFFSSLLCNFLVVTSVNFRNFFSDDIQSCSDSFLTHMKSVMSDTWIRNIFMKLFALDTLLSLIGSFLIDTRVIVYNDVSSQPHLECDGQIITLNDGKSSSLWTKTATTDKLAAGSFILAAICATTGHIGFLCETSYTILQLHRSDSYLMLTVLHVFASLCGSKYFGLSSHSLIMTVIRCIVTHLERENVAINATCNSYIQYGNESQLKFLPCAQCLFSNGVISVDEVLSLLLDKLEGCAVTVTGDQSKADVSDILSLVELLAYYMSWDWTRSKIVPHLLKIVESCVLEETLTAVILLIGQLGRFGIDDGRCEQLGVEELRCNLVAILHQKTTRKFGLPTQVAIVYALVGLLSSNFGDLLKNEVPPTDGSQKVYANIVRTWFSEQPEEQKLLSVGILEPAKENRTDMLQLQN